MYDAQGFIFVGIKLSDSDQARQNRLRRAREDLERQRIEHAAAPSVPEAADTVVGTLSNNESLLESLGTVLEKVQRIAEVTANAIDALAKVNEPLYFKQRSLPDFIFRFIRTQIQRGKS